MRAAAAGLAFRPVVDADTPFLFRLYASTRADEVAPLPWSDADKAAFLDMQARAQHSHYSKHFADADWLLIESGGNPAGRLYLHRREREHHIVDISLLPEHRGMGHGTALLRDLLDEVANAGKPMNIHVEKFNPAMRLYLRLGFVKVEDQGVYDLMRWTAPS
jgi:ribosomal protein S18 acetylase RimI-like enzyme